VQTHSDDGAARLVPAGLYADVLHANVRTVLATVAHHVKSISGAPSSMILSIMCGYDAWSSVVPMLSNRRFAAVANREVILDRSGANCSRCGGEETEVGEIGD